jgi:hypothetical protein
MNRGRSKNLKGSTKRAAFGRPAIDRAQFCTAGQARYGAANGFKTAPRLSLTASLLGRTRPTLRLTRCALALVAAVWMAAILQAAEPAEPMPAARLILTSKELRQEMSPRNHAIYWKPQGVEMIKSGGYSADNGQTWVSYPQQPDFDSRLPHGYRRESFPLYADPTNGWVLKIVPSMDTPGLDPSIIEPPIALETYYFRYRVSIDGGRNWLFDEPMVQRGKTEANPFDGVYKGKNGFFMGDVGSQLIRARSGQILIPAQACKLGPDGKLVSPGGGFTYTDVVIILGTWRDDHRLDWEISAAIEADPARSTRGMIEPTLAELPDGRIFCVMRGSNGGSRDPQYQLPSYRWWSVSDDGGRHWSKPKPWSWDNGELFFSPSSMSQLLKHSSGHIFWIGNISETNCQGNHPRYPLVIGQVDPHSLRLIRSSILQVDTRQADEPPINLSHWWGLEDRHSGDVIIVGARHSADYKSSTPVQYVIGVGQP